MGLVNSTPRPLYPRPIDPVPIVQVVGWEPGPVWTGKEYLALTGLLSPDSSARSESNIIIIIIIIIIKVKLLLSALCRYMGKWRYSPFIRNLGAIHYTPRPLYHRETTRYTLDRRLGGPQSTSGRFGEEKKISFPFRDSDPGRSSRYLVAIRTKAIPAEQQHSHAVTAAPQREPREMAYFVLTTS